MLVQPWPPIKFAKSHSTVKDHAASRLNYYCMDTTEIAGAVAAGEQLLESITGVNYKGYCAGAVSQAVATVSAVAAIAFAASI